ncbi:MAG: RHS domain-containing protein [Desulfocapsaceae bacterium]|nr:RHS domain-containing protein [Desulfocapsaceae bacterium]
MKAATLGSVNLTRNYDQRYNVARIKAGSFDYTYTRDAAGHVTGIAGIQSPTTSDEASNYSYNPANNQLTGTTGTTPKTPTYDANGNMITDGTFTFTYDGLNRIIQVEKQSATVATYGYDSSNRRIRKTVGATTTHYLYDLNNQLIAETLVDGTVLREYIYLDGEPMVLKEYQTNPGTYYFINDHLGTPQQLVTVSGAVVWQAAYLPFGKAQITTATVANNLRFPGQYYDAETGLHYNWNRFYDPEVGRYISADPIGLRGGLNLYAYVSGNPVNIPDKSGLTGGLLGSIWDDLIPDTAEKIIGTARGNKCASNLCRKQPGDDQIITECVMQATGKDSLLGSGILMQCIETCKEKLKKCPPPNCDN